MNQIEVIQGVDVTTLDVDAIQNAANGLLIHGAGVAGAIARAGGQTIKAESRATVLASGALEEGQAVWTTGGDLPARYVIHAVTMRKPGQRSSANVVHKATLNTLSVAKALHCRSLALVALGTGIGRVDVDDSAAAMAEAVLDKGGDLDVVFAVVNAQTAQAFGGALRRLRHGDAQKRWIDSAAVS